MGRSQTASRVGTESLLPGAHHLSRKRTAEELEISLAESTTREEETAEQISIDMQGGCGYDIFPAVDDESDNSLGGDLDEISLAESTTREEASAELIDIDMQAACDYNMFPAVNYDFDNSLAVDLETVDGCMVGPSFCPVEFFTHEHGWNDKSRNFFIKEHDASCGRAQLLAKCLLKDIVSCERIKQDDVWYTLYAVARFYKLTKSEKENICSLIQEISDRKDEKMAMLQMSIQNAMTEELSYWFSQLQVTGLVERIMKRACNPTHSVDDYQLPEMMNLADVRKFYTEGNNSIVMNLPCPTVDLILHDETCQFASADLEQLVNYALASNPQCSFYEAGNEDDWDPQKYVNNICSYRHQIMNSQLYRDSYRKVKQMLTDSPPIPRNTRVLFARVWSDGFEAHNVAPNNDYNSIQAGTFRLMGGQDNIFPAILAFKKHADKSLALNLIDQAKRLENVTDRYWGDAKTAIPTIVISEMMSNDLPERHSNTQTSFNGTYSKRFGYSCVYDSSVPSCAVCISERRKIILDGSCDNRVIPPCGSCKDWWMVESPALDFYPIPPGFDILNMTPDVVPNVKLSFKMIKNSLNRLFQWYQENEKMKDSRKVVEMYIKLLCVGSPDDVANELRMACTEGSPLENCPSYPIILKMFHKIGIEIDYFPSMVMHLFFLGLMKSLTAQSKRLRIHPGTRVTRVYWESLRNWIIPKQKELQKLSIHWCNTMSFNTQNNEKKKKKDLLSTGWMSSHCQAFARVLLFQFSPLDQSSMLNPNEDAIAAIKSFRMVLVLWFCLCANAFANVSATPTKLDHLVRLFLSACVDFDRNAVPEADSEDNGSVFFMKTPNFYSILNVKRLVEMFGSLRYIYEGDDEKFIKNIKREISVIQHNTSHLKVIMEKMLRTRVLNDLNRDNPLNKQSTETKLHDFKVYRPGKAHYNPKQILEGLEFITGVIDDDGEIYICFEPVLGKGIHLYPIDFDDTSGVWILNLWYARPTLRNTSVPQSVKSREQLKSNFADQFLLMKQGEIFGSDHTGKATVICRSWKVRNSDGKLIQPMPQEQYINFE